MKLALRAAIFSLGAVTALILWLLWPW